MDASFVMVGVVSSWCYPDTIAEAKRGMATIPQVKPKKAQIIDEAAAKISMNRAGARMSATGEPQELALVLQPLLRVAPNLHNRCVSRVSWGEVVVAL